MGKIIEKLISDTELVLKIYKKHLTFDNKGAETTQFKNGQNN